MSGNRLIDRQKHIHKKHHSHTDQVSRFRNHGERNINYGPYYAGIKESNDDSLDTDSSNEDDAKYSDKQQIIAYVACVFGSYVGAGYDIIIWIIPS